MKYLITIIVGIILFSQFSCSGEKKESWEINNFDHKQFFSLKSPENKTVNNVNIYIEGKFSGKIKLQRSEGYPVAEFSNDSIPGKLFYDFYGGEFQIMLLPSNAQGKINLTIEIPYSY
ncbi:hypothetical protein [Zunongwangia sp. H14]|uniref:hypothetical protein n=1 Tax=Zunongwangia sp. H14 TaxID=3240792 RepID=UPI003565607F